MPSNELEKLQGRWLQVSYERDGIANPVDIEKNWQPITEIASNTFVVKISDGSIVLTGVFKIHETLIPKAIDWIDLSGSYASDKPILAIYELTETDFAFCAAYDGGNRPTEFKTQPGQVLRRMKRL